MASIVVYRGGPKHQSASRRKRHEAASCGGQGNQFVFDVVKPHQPRPRQFIAKMHVHGFEDVAAKFFPRLSFREDGVPGRTGAKTALSGVVDFEDQLHESILPAKSAPVPLCSHAAPDQRFCRRLSDSQVHFGGCRLNSLSSPDAQRGYSHAIGEFIEWYCSEPRLSFNRTVVLRYRIHLESRKLAPATINLRPGAVRRLGYEAADCGLLSPDLAARIRRLKGCPTTPPMKRRDDNRVMAAGDAQRVWFPEMIEYLRARWHQGMPFEGIVGLRDDLDAMLQRIRSEGHIGSPVLRCRQCGYVGPGAEPHVSVRAMILSLTRFGIAAPEQIYALEKLWAAHRKQNELSLYGKRIGSGSIEVARCDHPQTGG